MRIFGEHEENTLRQLHNVAARAEHTALMADGHLGYVMPIGGVAACRDAIIPNAVGVDIGCGMCAVRTSLHANQLPESLRQVRNQVERDVPVGFNMHSNRRVRFKAASQVEAGLKDILDRHPGIASSSSAKLTLSAS